MLFRQISDPYLAQYAYLIGCQITGEAIVIDPERDAERYLAAAEDDRDDDGTARRTFKDPALVSERAG